MAPESVKTVFRRIEDELGMDMFHPHLMRHQAATALIRNNADLDIVARILCHSELETTKKGSYAHSPVFDRRDRGESSIIIWFEIKVLPKITKLP